MLRRQKKRLLYTLTFVFGLVLTFLGIGRDAHVEGVLKNYSVPTAEADTPPPYSQGSYYGQSGYTTYNQSSYYTQSGYFGDSSGDSSGGDGGDGDDDDDDGDGCP